MWEKYSRDSRIEFACFRFHVGLLSYQLVVFVKPDTENKANFDAVSSNIDAIAIQYKKAVLPQGNRAMPQVFFSVEVRQQHCLQV